MRRLTLDIKKKGKSASCGKAWKEWVSSFLNSLDCLKFTGMLPDDIDSARSCCSGSETEGCTRRGGCEASFDAERDERRDGETSNSIYFQSEVHWEINSLCSQANLHGI
jgi:hypothetical protein